MTEPMPTLKAIHICNSHQPPHRQKLQKSYQANAQRHNNGQADNDRERRANA